MPENDAVVKDKKCFIVSAIGEADSEARIHGEWFLDAIVDPAFEQFPRYEIKRSDLIRVPGMIDGQIINHLMDDHLVIADMTFLNANVFYEIGIRHVAQKPIIHMFRRDVAFRIPFDVHAFRAIEFDINRPTAITAAKDALIEFIVSTEQPDFRVENPVTRARGTQRLEENATPAERVILDRISALEARQTRWELISNDLFTQSANPRDVKSAANDGYFPAFYLTLDASLAESERLLVMKNASLHASRFVKDDHDVEPLIDGIKLLIFSPLDDSSINKLRKILYNIPGVMHIDTKI